MNVRDLDPAVWAAAYGAAFGKRHTIGDVEQEILDVGTCVMFADAAVFALRREEQREQGKETARDAAWARLVKAVETRWREDFLVAAQCDYQREIEAAKAALRALGVDEDLLRLGEP